MAKAPNDLAKAPAAPTETRSSQAIAFAGEKAAALQMRGVEAAASLQKKGGEACVSIKDGAVELARVTKAKSGELAKDRRAQVTAASAAAGGAGGTAVGLVTGGAVGAACGVPFALFTFGISIPISAMIGGGLGAATGGAVGATAGGAVGFGAFTKRAEIKAGIEKAKEVAVYFSARALAKAKDVKKQVIVRINSIRAMVQKKIPGRK